MAASGRTLAVTVIASGFMRVPWCNQWTGGPTGYLIDISWLFVQGVSDPPCGGAGS
jgi:hypothetical protein